MWYICYFKTKVIVVCGFESITILFVIEMADDLFIVELAHEKKGPYGFPGLWFFKCVGTVLYLGYRGNFSLKLPQGPYYMFVNSIGSGETVLMRRLVWAFAGHQYDEYPFLMCWLIFDVLISLIQ